MTLKAYKITELPEYSFLVVFVLEHSYTGETTDLNAFVCTNDVLCRAGGGECVPGQPVGRYVPCGDAPDPVTVTTDPPFYPLPEFTVYPNRVLETIASQADLDEYGTDPGSNAHGFYRADTVAMIFNTEDLMDKAINMIAEDLRKYIKIVEGGTLDAEVITHMKTTDDDSRDYFFRG